MELKWSSDTDFLTCRSYATSSLSNGVWAPHNLVQAYLCSRNTKLLWTDVETAYSEREVQSDGVPMKKDHLDHTDRPYVDQHKEELFDKLILENYVVLEEPGGVQREANVR